MSTFTESTMTDWWTQAACYGTYDHRFFGTDFDQRTVRLEYCLHCTVRDECAKLGDESKERLGVWGGERRKR